MNQVEQLQAELKKLQQEEQELLSGVSETESKISDMQKQIMHANSIQRSIESKLLKISQLKSVKNKLKQTVDDVKIKLDSLDSESLSKKLELLVSEEDKLRKNIDETETELAKTRKELDAITILQNKIKQQEEKNSSLKRRYAAVNNQVKN
jgi:chromosome segregation ATPase